MSRYLFIIFAFTLVIGPKIEASDIRVYSWWDFISKEAKKDLENSGYKTKVEPYKSNEQAIATLISPKEKFDVLIISIPVAKTLSKTLRMNTVDLHIETKSRNYYDFLRDIPKACLPYFWASTAFIYDSKNTKGPINTLQKLILSKKNGYKIGLVDDMHEFNARFNIDFKSHLKNTTLKLDIKSNEFVNTVGPFLKGHKVAAYGWHGEFSQAITSQPWLKIDSGASKAVIGMDVICVDPRTPNSIRQIKDYILQITNKKNTAHGVTEFQYFSPYIGHTANLNNDFKQLQTEIEKKVEKKQYFFNKQFMTGKELTDLNNKWRHIRYGK